MSNWTLFSNHGHVLVCLARNPQARLRDVASDVGITERAVQKIVRDLQDGGMISVTKSGRRNCYRIHGKQPLRHELESSCKLRDLIKVVNRSEEREIPSASPPVEPGQPVKSKAGPIVKPDDSATVSAKTVSARKPQKIKSESGTVESKDKDSGGSEKPAGVEKQQGSLF
jgi:DNA-binding MarR family transcriptional regulator